MSVFDEDLLNCVLNLFYCRHLIVAYFKEIIFYLLCDLKGKVVILTPKNLCCLEDRVGYFINIVINCTAVALYDFFDSVHGWLLS